MSYVSNSGRSQGLRLICHHPPRQTCHADANIDAFHVQTFLRPMIVPTRLPFLPQEPSLITSHVSGKNMILTKTLLQTKRPLQQAADGVAEGNPCKWAQDTRRESTAMDSPWHRRGRWPTDSRKYPTHALWKLVTDRYWSFCVKVGSPETPHEAGPGSSARYTVSRGRHSGTEELQGRGSAFAWSSRAATAHRQTRGSDRLPLSFNYSSPQLKIQKLESVSTRQE